jgi:hypothetical protein
MTTTSPVEMVAIERMYDQAMANTADMTGPFARPDFSDPWPATEEIDISAIEPPTPTRRPTPELSTDRPWRRWLAFLTAGAAPAH